MSETDVYLDITINGIFKSYNFYFMLCGILMKYNSDNFTVAELFLADELNKYHLIDGIFSWNILNHNTKNEGIVENLKYLSRLF